MRLGSHDGAGVTSRLGTDPPGVATGVIRDAEAGVGVEVADAGGAVEPRDAVSVRLGVEAGGAAGPDAQPLTRRMDSRDAARIRAMTRHLPGRNLGRVVVGW